MKCCLLCLTRRCASGQHKERKNGVDLDALPADRPQAGREKVTIYGYASTAHVASSVAIKAAAAF